MSEPGLYALTKIITAGISAVITGPIGSTDLPDIELRDALGGTKSSYAAIIKSPDNTIMGWAGHDRPGSPQIHDLPVDFIEALLSMEDARYGFHPGIDPVAIVSAIIDNLNGKRRGGSTITQQLVKNAITGADLTINRKIREAILAVRVQAAYPPEEILRAYLAKAWFGRGQKGAAGAALAWFGKPWNEIKIHEAAFLVGLLKGPAYYDPVIYPERALQRRNLVLAGMHKDEKITATDMAVAQALPLDVISNAETRTLFKQVPHWISSGISADLTRHGMMHRSDISSGKPEITTTISSEWQQLAQTALRNGINRLSKPGPAITLDIPPLSPDHSTTGDDIEKLRQAAIKAIATTQNTGRAIIAGKQNGKLFALIDRGYGPLEWDFPNIDTETLGYKPAIGDVLPFTRLNGNIVLQSVPQVQGAVIVMKPETGAILASIGGHDPDLFPFERTEAQRQPGSALKPFLWARAMEEGMQYDTLIEDLEQSYYLSNGETWRPKNYDHRQTGLIPLYIGLEKSSNLIAARLIDILGISSLASIVEFAGIYNWGTMHRHPSAALGTSETSLVRMVAGYAALANGGRIITPHRIASITRDNEILWTPPGPETGFALATPATIADITAMLYGVTQRGTAWSAFHDFNLPVAGKTGTTENHRDAWFISYTPGIVVGVWIGRDDFASIPGRPTGSRAAAPVARDIYKAALDAGLLQSDGFRPEQQL